MIELTPKSLEAWYQTYRQNKVAGRYVVFEDIQENLNQLNDHYLVNELGKSPNGTPIFSVKIGSGDIKIMLWTQMHGNESTGTKALFDLFDFFKSNDSEMEEIRKLILNNCTILTIPMLNPDGAKNYTRVNGNGVDLNRDAVDRKSIESQILYNALRQFDPKYCFNMHDQRVIFSVGENSNPATLSFLAPSINKEREVTEGRKETMRVIAGINKLIQQIIPGQVGRYTDEFYPTATGDNFEKAGYHTILVESGHFKNDYAREETRKYTFISVLQGLLGIAKGLKQIDFNEYFEIPNNEQKYLDVILKNVEIEGVKQDVGVLYSEVIKDGKLSFVPTISKKGNLDTYNGNVIEDLEGEIFKNENYVIAYIKKYAFNI